MTGTQAENRHSISRLLIFLKKILEKQETEVVIENNFAKPKKIQSLQIKTALFNK